MNKVKKPLTFRRVMLNYFKGFAVILLFGLILGFMYLNDYQRNLPKDVGDRVLKAIESMDFATLDTMSSNFPSSMKNESVFTKYMASFGTKDLFFYEGTSKVEGQLVYIFANNNKKMATLTLEKTGKKSMFGFEKYDLVDLVFKPIHQYTVINTTQSAVSVNGINIDDQVQALSEGQNHAFNKDIFGDLPVKTYLFKDFMFIDTVTAQDPSAEVVVDEANFTYTVIARPNQALTDSIMTYGEKVMKAHTRLLSIPSYSATLFINAYAYPGSDFAKTVRSYDLTVRYPFISESFADLSVTNVIQYGPHEYSVDVRLSYTWTATWYGKVVTRTTKPAYTFYVTDITGDWLVTDMTLLDSK